MGEKETAAAPGAAQREVAEAHEHIDPARPQPGPARPGMMAPGGGGGGPAEATNLNSSKSNAAREAGDAGDAEATTVKGSKSNSDDRLAGAPDDSADDGRAMATSVKSGKSNSSDRWAEGGGPEPAEAANLNSSRSNREATFDPGAGEPAETTIVKSKSNITNNRMGEAGGEEPPDPPGAAINTSHSNIKNLREAEDGDPIPDIGLRAAQPSRPDHFIK